MLHTAHTYTCTRRQRTGTHAHARPTPNTLFTQMFAHFFSGDPVWVYTKLNGVDLRLIQHRLELSDVYSGTTLLCMQLLWAKFDRLMVALHVPANHPAYLNPDAFHTVAATFCNLYLHLMPASLSVYIHDLCHHVPDFLRVHGTIYQFSTCMGELHHAKQNFVYRNHTMRQMDPAKALRRIMEADCIADFAGVNKIGCPPARSYEGTTRVLRRNKVDGSWALRADTQPVLDNEPATRAALDAVLKEASTFLAKRGEDCQGLNRFRRRPRAAAQPEQPEQPPAAASAAPRAKRAGAAASWQPAKSRQRGRRDESDDEEEDDGAGPDEEDDDDDAEAGVGAYQHNSDDEDDDDDYDYDFAE